MIDPRMYRFLDRLRPITTKADFPCPVCGPARLTEATRSKRVLAVWPQRDAFGFNCVRCGEKGRFVPDGTSRSGNIIVRRDEAAFVHWIAEEQRIRRAEKVQKIVARMEPAIGSPVERYLREARGIAGEIPPTIGYLPAYGTSPHAMAALFGFAEETEPGVIHLPEDKVTAVHLTRLQPGGRGKVVTGDAKMMLGPVKGSPVVLAPPNDLLSLVVCEGIETGLSYLDAGTTGVWVAGSASLMPALADALPPYLETVNIDIEEGDIAARETTKLTNRLLDRGFDVQHIKLWRE